jgi:hypothetical protein
MFFTVHRLSVSIQSICFWPSVPTYTYIHGSNQSVIKLAVNLTTRLWFLDSLICCSYKWKKERGKRFLFEERWRPMMELSVFRGCGEALLHQSHISPPEIWFFPASLAFSFYKQSSISSLLSARVLQHSIVAEQKLLMLLQCPHIFGL